MAQNAIPNPTSGERRSDLPASRAFCQFGRSPPRYQIASDTQRIDPISVWDDDAGMPRYQVPRFHMIAVIRSERTTQIP